MNSSSAYQEDYQEEVINGVVTAMSPRPAWNHVSAAGNIYNIFANYLNGKRCTPIPDGLDLFLSEGNRFIPDFMVVCDPGKIHTDGVHGAPDLVVEILSHSTAKNDRGPKMNAYAAAGVREYWIVDTANRSIEVYLLSGEQYTLHEIYSIRPDYVLSKMTEEERAAIPTEFRCSLFDDLVIRLEDVFARII